MSETVRVPDWVVDLESFRRWARSDDFPEHGRFCYLKGELWVDLSREQVVHNQVKGVLAIIVGGLVLSIRLGLFFHDRMRLTNAEVGLSTEPDGMFFTFHALEVGQVRLEEGLECLEIEGSPDMALEVISPTSVHKDTEVLRDLYWQAGIREYWLVDPRGDEPTFDILRHTAKGYVPTRKQAGWVKSTVFGKAFKLTQAKDAMGYPEYRLEVR